MMKAKQLRGKTDKELKELLLKKREELRQLRFRLTTKEIKNVRELQMVKKDMARILTILNENEKRFPIGRSPSAR